MSMIQDYIDLFSLTRKGHMAKYVYMHRPDIYEEILQQDTYYPFKMECDLLNQKSNEICKDFTHIRHIIELGPGSSIAVLSKTIPFVRSLISRLEALTYIAIDCTLEYAEKAAELVKKNFNHVETAFWEADFVHANAFDKIKNSSHINGSKLIISFGQPIFANNNDNDISLVLKNISNFLENKDYFLFGVDTHHNQESLEKAYHTELGYQFLLNTMHFLKSELNLQDFNPQGFIHGYQWDSKESKVELSLISTMDQNIRIGDLEILIKESQKFNILNSRKPPLEIIEKYLKNEDILIKRIISFEDNKKFSIVICQKQ